MNLFNRKTQQFRAGRETVLCDLTPSSLDQPRLAHTYLQLDQAAAGTASFSALSDRLADAELQERRDLCPRILFQGHGIDLAHPKLSTGLGVKYVLN